MKAKTRVSLVLGAILAGTAAFLIAATCAEIDKFYWIDERLATGGQPLLDQLPALKREGFRTIINLREPSEYDEATESAEVRRLGLRYLSIPFRAAAPKDEPVHVAEELPGDEAVCGCDRGRADYSAEQAMLE